MAETKKNTKKTTSTSTKQNQNKTVKNTQKPKTVSSTNKSSSSTTKKNTSTTKASMSSSATKKSTTAKKTTATAIEKKAPQKKTTTNKTNPTTQKKEIATQEKKPTTQVKKSTTTKKVANNNEKTKTTSATTKKKTPTSSIKTKEEKTSTPKVKTNTKEKQKTSQTKTKQEPLKTITSKEKRKGKEIVPTKKQEEIVNSLKKRLKTFGKKVQRTSSTFGKKAKEISIVFGKKVSIGAKKVGISLKKCGNVTVTKTKEISKKLAKGIGTNAKKFFTFLKTKKQNKKNSKKEPVLKKKQILNNKQKLEEFTLEEKREKKKRRPLRTFIILVLFIGIVVALSMVPYGVTTYLSVDSGKLLDVPKFVKIKEECCNYNATFSTPRSVWSLQKDLDKIISSYEILQCDGKEYYYNAKENYTITDYGIIDGTFLNQVYFTYGSGNSCNIETKFKKLELLADDFSLNDAKKDGNYVIDGDKVFNKSTYDDFMKNAKNKVPSTLRIVTTNKDGDVLITDVAYIGGNGKYKYMVSYDGTRDRNSKNHKSIIAYKYEHLKVHKNKLYAYNGDDLNTKSNEKYETYLLLTVPTE